MMIRLWRTRYSTRNIFTVVRAAPRLKVDIPCPADAGTQDGLDDEGAFSDSSDEGFVDKTSPHPSPTDPPSRSEWGPLIPQVPHRRPAPGHRYFETHEAEASVSFCSPTGHEGVRLLDLLNNQSENLVDGDDPMFRDRGPSVCIRIDVSPTSSPPKSSRELMNALSQWPGYQSWNRRVPTRNFRNPPGPITRAKLGKNVAKTVGRFITEHEGLRTEAGSMSATELSLTTPMAPHSALLDMQAAFEQTTLGGKQSVDGDWRVGKGGIEVKDLVLVRLDHLSQGSWQPRLRLVCPVPNDVSPSD